MEKIKKRDLLVASVLLVIGISFFNYCLNLTDTQTNFADEFEESLGIPNENHLTGLIVEEISMLYNPIVGFFLMFVLVGLSMMIFIAYLYQRRYSHK